MPNAIRHEFKVCNKESPITLKKEIEINFAVTNEWYGESLLKSILVIIGAKVNKIRPKNVEEKRVNEKDFFKLSFTLRISLFAIEREMLGKTATAIP